MTAVVLAMLGGGGGGSGGGSSAARTFMDAMVAVESMPRSSEHLTIDADPESIAIAWKRWTPLTLPIDGKPLRVEADAVTTELPMAPGKLRLRASWLPGEAMPDEIQLERRSRRTRVREHLLLPEEGADPDEPLVVVVTVRLPGDTPTLWLRQIYRPAPPT